jgi:hypothetical protein
MKYLSSIFIAALFVGCSVASPVQQEYMIVAPHSIVFSTSTPDTMTVSITHSCTCPFSWNATVSPASAWLSFPGSLTGDKTDIPISVDTALLTADTTRATILIVSNSYGDDSIVVTAIK